MYQVTVTYRDGAQLKSQKFRKLELAKRMAWVQVADHWRSVLRAEVVDLKSNTVIKTESNAHR